LRKYLTCDEVAEFSSSPTEETAGKEDPMLPVILLAGAVMSSFAAPKAALAVLRVVRVVTEVRDRRRREADKIPEGKATRDSSAGHPRTSTKG
jgi:hypothetical protein